MILKVENIFKYYNKKPVVNGVSIDLKQGEIVGLLGPNGAGKTTTEGKDFIKKLLEVIVECKQRFKPKEVAKIMIGESNSLIKQHMSQIQHVFGIGKEKSIQFWHSIIRQIYVKQLITKEIESYGVLKITSEGESFLKNPTSIKITEDHDYNAISDQKIISNQKGQALDNNLYRILKDLRKSEAKAIGLPPSFHL